MYKAVQQVALWKNHIAHVPLHGSKLEHRSFPFLMTQPLFIYSNDSTYLASQR
jgi:hypothetical protein